ncbi:TetR/AcrR family transcriptional regulator [Streptomyces sp. NPDC058321]|uniref:TetR/AcrR family transcriptional regulator n=1 Tax=Streptomyces sp. NPDC058321 TaxID=3346445 RepID=UPI0036E41956
MAAIMTTQGGLATPRLRRDTARTRDKLIAAAATLLAEQGPAFSLPDLARVAGISTATVYRHFNDVHEVFRAFQQRLADELVVEFSAVPATVRGRGRFEEVCRRWTKLAAGWGRAVIHIRNPIGFLTQVHLGEPVTSALYDVLAPVVSELVEDGVCPGTDLDYAVLVWVTLFDERAITDLLDLGWSVDQVSARLSDSALRALGAHLDD